MSTKILLAGAAGALLVAGGAAAGPKMKSAAATDSPKQPIPYTQLEAYKKASPSQRASKDWNAQAQTGMSVDTSANAPGMPAQGSMSGDAASSTQVNPPSGAAPPPAMPSTPPTNPPAPDEMTPQPGTNLPGSEPVLPPKDPM